MTGYLRLISCGIADAEPTAAVNEILRNADVVAGGKRLLAKYGAIVSEQVIIGANAVETVKQLIRRSERQRVVILASGDALFNGIGGTIERLGPPADYQVIPACTAFQHLYARLGTAWDKARVFSIHGRETAVPARQILNSPEAVVYCDEKCPAGRLAAELLAFHPESAERRGIIGERLGMADERIISGTLRELSEKSCDGLSMLLLKPSVCYPGLPLGLPDAAYQHENNLITHPEVRAIVLSCLRLGPGIMWDLGAGSGSVGIEAAGLVEHLNVYAVERKKSRFENIIENVRKAGINNHCLMHGDILSSAAALPDPDRVFIGGGGKELPDILSLSLRRLRPGGIIAVAAVTWEAFRIMSGFLENENWRVVTMNVSRSSRIAGLNMQKAENPVSIFCYNGESVL